MFDAVAGGVDLSMVREEAERAGFDGIRWLIFTRDPIAHGASVWQQRVKGWQGETTPIDTWLAERYRTPEQVRESLSRLDALGDFSQVTVRNYSRCRSSLLKELGSWLGVEDGTVASPPGLRENRSLTAAEATVQLTLNRILGPSGQLFAFPIVNAMPELHAQPLRPALAAQHAAWNRLEAAIHDVNRRVDEAQHYSFDRYEEQANQPPLALSEDQLVLIAEGLANEIRALRRRSPRYLGARAVNMIMHAASRLRQPGSAEVPG